MTTWKMALLSMSGGLNGNVLKKIWDLECACEGDASLESSTTRCIPSVRDFMEDPPGPLEGGTPQSKPRDVSSHGVQHQPCDVSSHVVQHQPRDVSSHVVQHQPRDVSSHGAQHQPLDISSHGAQHQPQGVSSHGAQHQPHGVSSHGAQHQPLDISSHGAQHQPQGVSSHGAHHQPHGVSSHGAQHQPHGVSSHGAQHQPHGVSSHGAHHQPQGPLKNTRLLQEGMKAPPTAPPARRVPSITDFLGSLQTASTSATPTSLPHSTTPTSLPHSTTPTSPPHWTTPTSQPHWTTPTSPPHRTTPASPPYWTHTPVGRASSTTLLSPTNPIIKPGVPAQSWGYRSERAKELLSLKSGVELLRYSTARVDRPLTTKSGVDNHVQLRTGVDNHVQPRTGVDNHVQLRTGVDNHVQPRTGVDTHVQPRTGVDNHVQPRTGVDNHVQPRTGVDNHVQPRTGVDNHVQPRTGVDTHVQLRTGVDTHVQPRTGVDNHVQLRTGVDNHVQLRTGVDTHVQPRTGVDNHVQLRTGVDNRVQPRTGVDNSVQLRTGVDNHVHCTSVCGEKQSLNSLSGVMRPSNMISDSSYLCAWKPANLVGLPYELLVAILDSLSDPDLLTCHLVCKRLSTAATDKLRGHRIVLSKRSDVGEYDFDMISLIQPISLEMSHVTGHVTMECIRRFIQSCSKSVKVFKYINSHFISPLGTRIPLLYTLSFHWREVVALEVMFLHSLFSQDVITACLQQFNNLQRISLDGNPKSCKTAIRTLASYHSGMKYLSVPAHSLMSMSGKEVVSEDKQSLRDTLEELEIKSIPKPNLDWLSMFGEVLRSLKNLVALSLSARVELTMDESQYIMEVVKDSQPSLVLQGDGQVSFRMQWRQ